MAANRYGQIWHGDSHHINIRFPSTEARLKFQNEFEEYHASHDHEGDIPTFECVTLKDLKLGTGSRSPEDLVKAETNDNYRITIDGYGSGEIHKYHNPTGWNNYFHYHVPTCCVPPVIVVDHEFVDSNTLERHELSAIFGDMPAEDYASLLSSVEKDGFIDNVIRLFEGQILDGWHRYRAAKELNLIRKLRFTQWYVDEHRDGDPEAFVFGRNIARRHLNASQRAQIAVTFNERFGHGTNRHTLESSNGDSKTREQLAKGAGVGTSTIDRAVAVEKAGESEAVIAGEKTASEVLESPAVKVEKKNRYQAEVAETAMLEAFKKTGLDAYMGEDDLAEEITQVYRYPDFRDFENEDALPWINRFITIKNALEKKAGWVQDLHKDFEEFEIDKAADTLIALEPKLTTAWNPDRCEWEELLDAIEKKFDCDRTILDSILNESVVPGPLLDSLDEILRWTSYLEKTLSAIENEENWISGKTEARRLPAEAIVESSEPPKHLALGDIPLDDILMHITDRVVHIQVNADEEMNAMREIADILGKVSRGQKGTQLHILFQIAQVISIKGPNDEE